MVLRTIHLLYDRDTETNTKQAGTTGNTVISYTPQQGAATQEKKNDKERAVQQSARRRTLPQSGVWHRRPTHTARLELYYGNGAVLSRGVDPTLAFETSDNILIHSSLLILSPRTHIQQTLSNSIVHCYMLGQGMDNKQYTLWRSIRWAMKQPPGWVSITFVQRVHKTMKRSFEYTDLLKIAHHKVSTSWLKAKLSVEHLWIMWAISR